MRVTVGRAELPAKPHALYRFYDRTDVLLYVGISLDLPARLRKHKRDKPWWLEIANITIEPHESRADALAAEAIAIETERPLYNDQHNPTVLIPDPVPPSPDQPDVSEPCGEDCDDDCRSRHGDQWYLGRNDLSICIIDHIRGQLGDDRFGPAQATAEKELRLPDEERSYAWETDHVVVVAEEMVQATVADVWRFRFVLEELLRSLPPGLVAQAEGASAEDWYKAGEPDACRLDQLPDILRHLGYALRDHFGAVERGADVP